MRYDPSRFKPAVRPARVCVFERSVHIERPPAEVFAFCCDGDNFRKISPDPVTPHPDNDETIVALDHVYVFRYWMGGFVPVRWVAHIVELTPDREYVDVLLGGPLRYFRHTHRCEPAGEATLYRDIVEYRSFMGWTVDRTVLRRMYERLFAERQRRMKMLLESGARRVA